jgi:hypothetical protein
MKPLKLGLRVWILITSLFSFLGGWALLSHAGKPAPLGSVAQPVTSSSSLAPMPTLPAVPSIDSLTSGGGNLQPLPSLQLNTSQSFFPRMRTGGS